MRLIRSFHYKGKWYEKKIIYVKVLRLHIFVLLSLNIKCSLAEKTKFFIISFSLKKEREKEKRLKVQVIKDNGVMFARSHAYSAVKGELAGLAFQITLALILYFFSISI